MNNQIEIQQLFENIKSLSETGKHVEAGKIIAQVIEKYPQSAAEAYYISASNFTMPGNSRSHHIKEFFLMKAIEIEPSHVKFRMALAQLYFSTPLPDIAKYRGGDKIAIEGEKEKAIKEYERVIEIDSDYSEAYEHRAYIYEDSGHHKSAIEDFSHAVKLSPDNFHLRLARGNFCLKTENYDIALDDLRKILSLNPVNPDAIKFLEAILHKKNDLLGNNDIGKIIKEYEENMDVDSDNPNLIHEGVLSPLASIYSVFGQILAQNGDHKQAIIKYNKSIEYQDKTHFRHRNSDTHYFIGNAYSDLGQYKEAIVEYDKAIKKDHNHHSANEGRSNALLKLIEKQESDFQGKIEEFLSGPNSIFGLHDRFLEREKECVIHYHDITRLITFAFALTSLTIASGILVLGWWINRSAGFSFENNAFSLLPYIAVLLLFTAVPVWWTRILLKSRDRWQVLQEDCFRKAAIMQYIQATGSDKEFRNHIILETIKHMANRSGADLLVALHSDEPGMLYSATDIMEKIIKKKPSNG